MGVTGVYLGARSDVLETISHIQSKKDRWAALAAPRADGHGAPPRRRASEGLYRESAAQCTRLLEHQPSPSSSAAGGWPIHAALVPLLDESNMREDKIVDRPPLEVCCSISQNTLV